MIPDAELQMWRGHIPLLRTHIPMNNCSHAPQTVQTAGAVARFMNSWESTGMDWETWMAEVQLARDTFAKLINASVDEIAVVSSVSAATSAVASALNFNGPRRTVLVSEAEFPTVGHVWLAQESRGARVKWVPLSSGAVDPAAWDAQLNEETLIVSACHGYYLNGAMQDLASLTRRAHQQGALVFIDAYQTLGAVPIDVASLEVDFLASGNLKYLMGVPGIAFLYVRKSLTDQLRPTVTGWFGRSNPFAFELKELDWSPTANRFNTGTPPILNAYIAHAGMDIISSVGVNNIRACHEVLGQRLIDGGRARGLTLHGHDNMKFKTANTAFVVNNGTAVEAAMRARGVLAAARGPVIRLAPHFYNTLDDCDVALDVLAGVVNAPGA